MTDGARSQKIAPGIRVLPRPEISAVGLTSAVVVEATRVALWGFW